MVMIFRCVVDLLRGRAVCRRQEDSFDYWTRHDYRQLLSARLQSTKPAQKGVHVRRVYIKERLPAVCRPMLSLYTTSQPSLVQCLLMPENIAWSTDNALHFLNC